MVYKGKIAHRSWPQLPPELIRHIATFYLVELSKNSYIPQTWMRPELWQQRMAYSALTDSRTLHTFMAVCPSWGLAVEHHLFWQHAIALLDPLDSFASNRIIQQNSSAPPIRLSPYQHHRNLSAAACHICRINSPGKPIGLSTARRLTSTPTIMTVPVCKEHVPGSFCGVCLAEAHERIRCSENEDEQTFPGVDWTCRDCRAERMSRATTHRLNYDALGGPGLQAEDWETKQALDAFIEIGEGTVQEVLAIALDKHWLRCHTKLPDLLKQTIASARYASEPGEQQTQYDDSDEDDPEYLQMHEEGGGVRELAINDWARTRILAGHWLNPADQYYATGDITQRSTVPASHPCPWNLPSADEAPPDLPSPCPPSFHLCEQAFGAFGRQLRTILLPAMSNIVRKVVLESAYDGADARIRLGRFMLEDVVKLLADENVWYDGFDWIERRRNNVASDASTSSDSSPVLSTSTLQTTPSPPASDKKSPREERFQREPLPPTPMPIVDRLATAIPVTPVLSPPRLLHPIPYVPVTTARMEQHTIDMLRSIWRDACAPLYHCRCSICERAMVHAANNNIPNNASVSSPQPLPQAPLILHLPAPTPKKEKAKVQEEYNPFDSDAEWDSQDEEEYSDTSLSYDENDQFAPARKRSLDELEAEHEQSTKQKKKARLVAVQAEEEEESSAGEESPSRGKKRGSKELSEDPPVLQNKRARGVIGRGVTPGPGAG